MSDDDWRARERIRSGPIVEYLAARLIGPMRLVARDLGYALAVHGSLRRDIDLVAVPWTDAAVDPDMLIDRLVIAADSYLPRGKAYRDARDHVGCKRAHGRMCIRIQTTCGTYIDLSIMPRVPIR